MKKSMTTLSALILALLSTVTTGQGLVSMGDSSAGNTRIVEREQVLTSASDSFRHHVDLVLAESGTIDIDPIAREILANFITMARNKLIELEGDGVLTASEVSSELGAIRAQHEQELLSVVSAMRSGSSPPPLQADFDSLSKYTLALVEYTLKERNSSRQWLIFLLYVIAGLIVAWALNAAAEKAARWSYDHEQNSASKVANSLGGPLYLTALSLGLHFGVLGLWVPNAIRNALNGTIDTMLVGALFWLLWNACPSAASAICTFVRSTYSRKLDDHTESIIVRVMRMLVVVVLILVVVRVILDTNLSSLLAGLGVIGLALYFILRGTFENVAASFTIFGDAPFRVGDLVVFDKQWGTIEAIGFRSTRLRTLKGHLITIPNSELINTAIQNAGARPSIRRRLRLQLPFRTSVEKIEEAMQILRDILDEHEGMPKDEPPRVEFETIGEYGVQLLVQYHYEPADFWQALRFDTEVNLNILQRFEQAGVELALPSETHIVETSDSQPPQFDLVGANVSRETDQ